MSQATNFFPSQNVSVWIQNETTVGTEPDDAALTKLQVTSFTIPEASVPVEYSSQQTGSFVTKESQGHHSEGTKVWTFETTLRGTVTSVLLATEAVMESSTSEATLNNDYTFPHTGYSDGSTSSPKTFDIRFVNAGAKADTETIEVAGCIGTGFTLSESVGSDGGELVCVISWATAYMPQYSATDITSPAYDVGSPKNIRSLTSATDINDGSAEEIVLQSWELSVQRTIERIHYKDTTAGSFVPFGYAMTGGFEVTGSLTVIRNEDVDDLRAKFYNGTTVDINIAEASGFAIALDKCFINEPSIDSSGAVLMETIPFTVVATDASASTKMLGITIA